MVGILNWASDAGEEYMRGLWLALMNVRHPRDRALLLAELDRLNGLGERPEPEEGAVGGNAGVDCQASAREGSDRPCREGASWCLTLGRLQHFHVCATHALRLLTTAAPYFTTRKIEDCPHVQKPVTPIDRGSTPRTW